MKERETFLLLHMDPGVDYVGRRVEVGDRHGTIVGGNTLTVVVEWDDVPQEAVAKWQKRYAEVIGRWIDKVCDYLMGRR